jgi:NAD(P)-dependent dehydrogenase (short-subunit alcohol dehydrogenase family)
MDLELSGKTAIVTGGSRGIGRAVARELAVEGMDVVIAARGREALETAARELTLEAGRRVVPIPCDTGSDVQVREMVDRAAAAVGGIDVLVNCAARPGGQAPPPRLAEIDDELFWSDVNVKALGA